MNHLRTFAASSILALTAVTLGLPMAAHAQYDTKNYDGYCYTRKNNAGTNGAVVGAVIGGLAGSQVSKHERGLGTVGGAVIGGVIGNQVGKSSVKCYNGAYYAYRQGAYYSPPPAPEGYDVIYFRDRPQTGYYDNVYYDAPKYGQQQAYGGTGYDTPYGAVADDSDYQSKPYDDGQSQPQPYRRYSDNSSSGYSSQTYSSQTYQGGNYQNQGYGAPRPRNVAEGWRDDQGQWHDGRPRNVGWQDDQGRWHVGQVVAYGWQDDQGGWHEEFEQLSEQQLQQHRLLNA